MSLTRRAFLDRTALATAAAALATRPFQQAVAQDEPSKTAGPNDKIRVAVIGVNGQGGAHVGEWMANPEVDLVAICDADPNAYKKHVKRFEGMKTPPRYEHRCRFDCHAKSLACIDGGLGHASWQRCVRGKAL